MTTWDTETLIQDYSKPQSSAFWNKITYLASFNRVIKSLVPICKTIYTLPNDDLKRTCSHISTSVLCCTIDLQFSYWKVYILGNTGSVAKITRIICYLHRCVVYIIVNKFLSWWGKEFIVGRTDGVWWHYIYNKETFERLHLYKLGNMRECWVAVIGKNKKVDSLHLSDIKFIRKKQLV